MNPLEKRSRKIVEEVRKEFGIKEREWNYLCFEGDYVPNMIKSALKLQREDELKFLNLILIKDDFIPEVRKLIYNRIKELEKEE